SSPENQADKIVAAFAKKYPDVKVQHVRITGGNTLAARAIQEVQARGHTADLLTGGATHTWQLAERDLLLRMDYGAIGIDKKLTPTDFAIATAASVYTVIWNSNKVKDDEAPSTWEEMNDPKWAGRMGSWVRAAAWAQLAKAWGKDKAEQMLREHIKLKPFLFKSTFPMAQQVAAGEVDVALGFFHTAQPPIQKGAPVRLRALDPTPMHTIYSSITKSAPNLAGAKLLIAWLTSTEGNLAYESATNRGSPLISGTKTADLLVGKNIAEWPPEETQEFSAIGDAFNKILAGVGQAR
ncbi:MAG: extracellular solute-binding protein, partial [Burkholderiales bacterium]